MRLSDYKFHLPVDLIALHPRIERDKSRLMVVNRKTGEITHKHFYEVINYFDDGDVMVVNNTKVFPARIYGKKEKTGAKIEVFLLRELDAETKLWDVMVDPARKIRVGNKLFFGKNDEFVAEVIDNTTSRGRTIRFIYDRDNESFRKILKKMGEAPIYTKIIKRAVTREDKDHYQTIFAKHEGAVAAPTAGMHFTKELVKRAQIQNIEFAEITHHAGLCIFKNIEVEDLGKHKMESQEIIIPQETCEIVNNAISKQKRICAVGTTTMQTIESSVTFGGELRAYEGWTNLFIYHPYEFKITDILISNFHLPQSPLMIMVSAFTGHELLMKAYKTAIEEKYKFFSFGDAMLIL